MLGGAGGGNYLSSSVFHHLNIILGSYYYPLQNITTLILTNSQLLLKIFSGCIYNVLLILIISPSPGVSRKYLLQNCLDERRTGQTQPIKIPMAKPIQLQVDA